jgi:ring-1,2-phenylacetyl-CoA epoxidase subunit PaaB
MAPASRASGSARPAAAPHLEPYEVFRQEKEGDPMTHGGSVMAPDPELAVHYARELYGRRQESERLWIVRRTDVRVLDDPDWLQPPLDRSFKKPGGYVMRDKLGAARAKAGQAKAVSRRAGGSKPSPGSKAGAGAKPEARS